MGGELRRECCYELRAGVKTRRSKGTCYLPKWRSELAPRGDSQKPQLLEALLKSHHLRLFIFIFYGLLKHIYIIEFCITEFGKGLSQRTVTT